MKKLSIGVVTLSAVGFVLSVSGALSAAVNQTPQQTLKSLVGAWNCTNSGGGSPSFTERDVDSMYGHWLRINASYSGYAGIDFLGYNTKRHRWIFLSADEHGGYGIVYSNSPGLNGSSWHDGYPVHGNSGTFRIVNSKMYRFDGMGPDAHGKMVASRTVCKR